MIRNLESILIAPTISMAKTIEVIDKGAKQLALVVDTDKKLLGIVTDGDIRRALLKHLPMSCEISKVMNKAPSVVAQGTSKTLLLAMMKKQGLLAIPLVKNGVVVDQSTLL